mmetsp:Transcript_52558/g.162567  ORF Transcript_52558/g.162567 Transcript_52558/m.162567 type:complete len:200 (+) Transcript_52558:827-1426(+)
MQYHGPLQQQRHGTPEVAVLLCGMQLLARGRCGVRAPVHRSDGAEGVDEFLLLALCCQEVGRVVSRDGAQHAEDEQCHGRGHGPEHQEPPGPAHEVGHDQPQARGRPQVAQAVRHAQGSGAHAPQLRGGDFRDRDEGSGDADAGEAAEHKAQHVDARRRRGNVGDQGSDDDPKVANEHRKTATVEVPQRPGGHGAYCKA